MNTTPTDTEILDWIAKTGASLNIGSQPDMGGRDWQCCVAGRRLKQRQRSPREAIMAAMREYGEFPAA